MEYTEYLKPDHSLINIKAPGFNMRNLFNGTPTYATNRFKKDSEIKTKTFINDKGYLIPCNTTT